MGLAVGLAILPARADRVPFELRLLALPGAVGNRLPWDDHAEGSSQTELGRYSTDSNTGGRSIAMQRLECPSCGAPRPLLVASSRSVTTAALGCGLSTTRLVGPCRST